MKWLQKKLIIEQFYPGLLGLFFNPFYSARKGLLFHIRAQAPLLRGRLLDVGCGTRPYEKLFTGVTEYVGLEVDDEMSRATQKADQYYDGKSIPYADASFTSIFSSQVLEHVFNPEAFLQELHRVLEPGGKLLLTVPFVWDEHEQPRDFGRYTSFGLRALFERNGFKIIAQEKSVADIRALFQLAAGYMYKKTLSWRRRHLDLLVTLICIAPLNILGEFFNWFIPGNPDLYLDNVVLAQKK